MKPSIIIRFVATTVFAAGLHAQASESTTPLAGPDLVYQEKEGVLAIEAEHFYKQTLTDKRAWHITSSKSAPDIKPDSDPPHVAGASGGAYLEILPDTRATHGHKMVFEENFTDKPGVLAVVHYKVNINTPGRYYVWVRSFSTGSEDNGVHVGLNGQWPDSGQRWQTINKNAWAWDCKQRTEDVHTGVPMQLFLDISKAGEHEIMFSLREDGFEMDKIVLASSKDFIPEGMGPEVKVKSGTLPASFPLVPQAAAEPRKFPAHWGEPPAAQTRDLRPLPGGFGEGSGTLAKWLQDNLDKDATASAGSLKLEASDFAIEGSGYYLDQGKWLAIHPEKNKEASAATAFPFPSGKYDMTLHAVGESDGQSTFQVAVNDSKVGEFKAPLSEETFEEGPKYSTTWKGVEVSIGDVLKVSSQIASSDGKEWSRARVSGLEFSAADDATKQLVAEFVATKPSSAAGEIPPGIPLVLPRKADGKGTVQVSGELKEWHKVTLTLDGPYAHELDNSPNPFTESNLTITFTHESGAPSYKVPGYFAADGEAGESSADSGTKWRAHLAPDKPGAWTYNVSFTQGHHAALDGGGSAVKPFDGITGRFEIAKTDKTGRDFRAHGRLSYVGKHHLQFAGSKQYFLKAGPDSPENFLGSADFDGTTSAKRGRKLKTWHLHVKDWREGDPAWKDGKGKGMIGALNYLADKGCNAFSFLTYNAGGDGDDVWPFIKRDEKFHYDCSKLDQWTIVLDHATENGVYCHFKLQETENDDNRAGDKKTNKSIPTSLDGGELGPERKLYLREIVSRFGHLLALNWNFGEENTQSTEEQQDMIAYLAKLDAYQHLRVLHTYPGQQTKVYTPLLGKQSGLTGASIQIKYDDAHNTTLEWLKNSANANKPWVVAYDEQGGADTGVPPDIGYEGYDGKKKNGDGVHTTDDIRKFSLWGTLMAGGAGVEYYFGYQLPQNDLNCEDFRSRDKSWDYCRIAIDFFHKNKIPFWDMKNANRLIGNQKDDNSRYCFAKEGEIYLVYLPDGGETELDLSEASGTFSFSWFNPRQGGDLDKSQSPVKGGEKVRLIAPDKQDWLAIVSKE